MLLVEVMSRAQENYMNKMKMRQQQQQQVQQQVPQMVYYPPVTGYQVMPGQVVPGQVVPAQFQGVAAAQQPQVGAVGYPQSTLVQGGEEQKHEEKPKNVLEIYGNSTTFNINTLLYNNILEADYFKALYQLRTYHEIVGKILFSPFFLSSILNEMCFVFVFVHLQMRFIPA